MLQVLPQRSRVVVSTPDETQGNVYILSDHVLQTYAWDEANFTCKTYFILAPWGKYAYNQQPDVLREKGDKSI